MTQQEKLQSVIPQLITRAKQALTNNERATHYDSVSTVITQLEEGFKTLNLNTQELGQIVDIEQKQNLEEAMEYAFSRISAMYIVEGLAKPDFLQKKVESTADFYQRAFEGLTHGVPEAILQFMDAKGFPLSSLQSKYEQWLSIQAAQQQRSINYQRVMYALDIKEAVIGIMRLLNIPRHEISIILWQAGN